MMYRDLKDVRDGRVGDDLITVTAIAAKRVGLTKEGLAISAHACI
jgi:hypothetical protein